jgi:hypothetical protein
MTKMTEQTAEIMAAHFDEARTLAGTLRIASAVRKLPK